MSDQQERKIDPFFISRMLINLPDNTEFFYDMFPWGTVADGYMSAGNALADAIVAIHPNDSPLVFPMLFNYRHCVELRLKDLIHVAQPGLLEPFNDRDFGHNLTAFLNRLNVGDWHLLDSMAEVEEEVGEEEPSLQECVNTLRAVCGKFATADPDSYRYRYPIGKNKKKIGDRDSFEPHPYPKLMKELQISSVSELKALMGKFDTAVRRVGIVVAMISDAESARPHEP